MYCSGCGTFSRSEVPHACDDPLPETILAGRAPAPASAAALAHPVQAVGPAEAAFEVADAVPADWYPDGDVLRWWDGTGWTDHVAVAEAHAAPAPAPTWPVDPWGAPGWASGPAWGPHGRFLGAIPRTLSRGARYDLLVYEHSIVMAKVPGMDPALIFAGLGLFFGIGGLLGYLLGDYVGASGNTARVGQLSARAPESIAGDGPKNRIVPRAAVGSAKVETRGKSGGRLELRLHDGTRLRHRWTPAHTKGTRPDAMLAQPLAGLATFRRGSRVATSSCSPCSRCSPSSAPSGWW